MRHAVTFLLAAGFALAAFAAQKPDSKKTTLVQNRVAGGVRIILTLRDKLGRNIGPGQASHLALIINSRRLPGPGDQGDGTYAVTIPYNGEAPVSVTVTYDGAPLAKTELVPQPRKHH